MAWAPVGRGGTRARGSWSWSWSRVSRREDCVSQPCGHLDDAEEESLARFSLDSREGPPRDQHIEAGSRLKRGPPGRVEVATAVFGGPLAVSLRDVQGDRSACAIELIDGTEPALGQGTLEQFPSPRDELDPYPVDVEPLVMEHVLLHASTTTTTTSREREPRAASLADNISRTPDTHEHLDGWSLTTPGRHPRRLWTRNAASRCPPWGAAARCLGQPRTSIR